MSADPSDAPVGLAGRGVVARRPGDPGLFLALAPMDGVTDASYRGVLTDLLHGRSGISQCVSEFVRVVDRRVQPKVLARHCPELLGDGHTAAGVPVFVQLLGGDAAPMADSAALAADMGAVGIDLNFGCPAKTVNRHDGGATLLKAPCRVRDVAEAVRAAVPGHIPVTVKIRVGWDSAAPVVDLALAAEAGGASWLTIHGRTRAQLYRPPVDWAAIGQADRAVAMPVVANGDLFDPGSIERCAAVSGCEHFMIGRGAMGSPDLFARVRGWRDRPLTTPQIAALLVTYALRMLEQGRPEFNVLGRLKQWLRMGAMQRADLAGWFDALKRQRDVDVVLDALRLEAAKSPTPSRVGQGRSPARGNALAH